MNSETRTGPDPELTDKYPGAVFVLGVPGHRLAHPQVSLPLVQFVDQLHLRQRTENKEGTADTYEVSLSRSC